MHIHFVNHTLVLKINLLIVDSSKAEELAWLFWTSMEMSFSHAISSDSDAVEELKWECSMAFQAA